MATLNWLVNQSQLNNLKFITGENHRAKKIRSVNVLDNPDVLKWLKKDELVLTTGYVFKDDPQLQRQMIRDLKEIGCTALAIKIRRFFRTIPTALIDEAKKLDFPVIELPFFYSFSQISETIFYQIYQEKELTTGQQQQFLFNLMNKILQNEPITFIVKQISQFLKIPILLTDINYSPLNISFPKENFANTPNVLKDIEAHLSLQIANTNKIVSLTIKDKVYSLKPIPLPNQSGYLCLLYNSKKPLEINQNILSNIMQLLALSCKQNTNSHTNYDNSSTFFLNFLIHQEKINLEEMQKLCAFYGFDYQKTWICLTSSLEKIPQEKKSAFIQSLRSLIEQLKPSTARPFICNNTNLFCTYFLFPINCHRLNTIHQIQQLAKDLHEQILRLHNISIRIGISSCHSKVSHIRPAFDESLQALQYQQQIDSNLPGSYLHQVPIHLLNNYDKNLCSNLKYNILKPLIDFDFNSNTKLVHTLEVYFACNCNASNATKVLYLHRNTMLNRLEKIKELLHTDFSNAEENMLIYLSLISLKLKR